MRTVMLYALVRIAFGLAVLVVPALAGRLLAGEGGALPDAQAFLRGMGGRETGIGLGLVSAIRADKPVHPWLIAGVLADSSDIVGIGGAWSHMPRTKRWLGLSLAGGAAAMGATLLATLTPQH